MTSLFYDYKLLTCTNYERRYSFSAHWDQYFVFFIAFPFSEVGSQFVNFIHQNLQSSNSISTSIQNALNRVMNNTQNNLVGFVMKVDIEKMMFFPINYVQQNIQTENYIIRGIGPTAQFYSIKETDEMELRWIKNNTETDEIYFVQLLSETQMMINMEIFKKQIQSFDVSAQQMKDVCLIFVQANQQVNTISPLVFSGNITKIVQRQYHPNHTNNVRIVSLYKNNSYLNWIDKNLQKLQSQNNFSVPTSCNLQPDCFIKKKVVGRGGGSYIIETSYSSHCTSLTTELFLIDPKYTFVMKLCDIGILYEGCYAFSQEAYNLLLYSKLFAHRICETFTYTIGYGINCCVLLSRADRMANLTDMKKLENYSLLTNIFKTDRDIEDYYEAVTEDLTNTCDSFILMNYLPGKDLSQWNATNKKLSHRQLFELVYGYLCSCHFFGFIPADVHADNFIEHNSGSPLSVTIGNQKLTFTDLQSLVAIDYQATNPTTNIYPSDIKIQPYFVQDEIFQKVMSLLSTNQSCLQKIYALPKIFQQYINNSRTPSSNIKLRFVENL